MALPSESASPVESPKWLMIFTLSLAIGLLAILQITRDEEHVNTSMASERGRQLIERSLDQMGPAKAFESVGLQWRAFGVLNPGVEHQGYRPDDPSSGQFSEILTLRPDGAIAYELRHDRFDGTFEHFAELYPTNKNRIFRVSQFDPPLWIEETTSARFDEGIRTLKRRIPSMLLEEILASPEPITWVENTDWLSLVDASVAGSALQLGFDEETGILSTIEFNIDVQTFGDSHLRWEFADYNPIEGAGMLPNRTRLFLNDNLYLDLRVDSITSDTAVLDEAFAKPNEVLEFPSQEVGSETPRADIDAEVREIEPGIFVVQNLRSGFHPMFFELDEYLVATDAPAGYPTLYQIPPREEAPGPSNSWLSERYLELMKQHVPNKPVRYAIITHFHSDHAGGLRAFVAEGSTIIAPETERTAIERFLAAPHMLAPDRLSSNPQELQAIWVEDNFRISDGTRTIDILDVGPSPHSEQLLVAHHVEANIMFTSDLFEPTSNPESYPLAFHESLDRFFLNWLDAHNLASARVFTMHAAGEMTPAHIEELREAMKE